MPKMEICRTLGMGQRRTLAQCPPVNAISSSAIAKSLTLSPEPQKAVKALGRRLQANLSPKDVSRAMAGVYVDLQKKGHNPVMATYIRDLYDIGEAKRYFDQAKNAILVVDANGKPIKVASVDTERYRLGQMPNKRHKAFRKDISSGKRDKKNAVGRSKILGGGYRYHNHLSNSLDLVSKAAEPASVDPELQVAKEKAQAIIDAAQKTKEGITTTSVDSSQCTPNDAQQETIASRINFDTIVEYCLDKNAKYEEIKPVYDMLLERLYGVTDPKWMEAKERIYKHMRDPERSRVVTETVNTMRKQQQSTSKKSTVTNAVFVYNYQDNNAWKRWDFLRQKLTKNEWLDENTTPEDFCAIFGGKPSSVKVKWIGAQSQLYYLIKTLLHRRLIRCPEGQKRHWIIVSNHFVDRNSRTFKDWNSQRDPKRSMSEIENMVDHLDPRLKDLL